MKNKKNYLSPLISHLSSLQKGFTLIELMVAIGITAVLGTIGIAGFVNYNKVQVLQTSSNEVVTMLNLAKSRAQSQIKPSGCTGELEGYSVKIVSDRSYALYFKCQNEIKVNEQDKQLPTSLSFNSDISFFFPVQAGGVQASGRIGSLPEPWQIVISGSDERGKTITINSLGGASVQSSEPLPAHYNTLTPGLVGWWKFDGNAEDSTPQGNDGTITGATLVNDRKGQPLKAYSFNIGDSFTVGNSGINGNTWTWSAWLYWRANNNSTIYGGYLWSAVGGSPTQWIEIYLDKATRGFRITRSNPTSLEQVLSSQTVTLNQWTFLTVTFNNGSLTGYVNNQSAGTISVGALTVPVGASLNGYVPRDLDGVVDDIRVYNKVLSAAEITELYGSY